ncbi:acyl-CoA carboxylase epsilon subunit [Kitasatospora sp. NPDC059827]|uniref:acyl-CoA carboxylase epsilon subunit n=1 Tax=Kitasatospora sp. NPDC059827 TaxID=3346964 RepID=UPI0036524711
MTDRPALFRTALFRTAHDLTPEEIATLTVLLLQQRATRAAAAAATPTRRTVRWHDVSLRPPVPTTSWQIVA